MGKSTSSRLDSIILMLAEFSRGNFAVKLEVSDDEDPLNTVIAGLNMLGEELESYRREVEEQRSFLQDILSSIDEVIYVRDVNDRITATSPFTFMSGRSTEIIGLGFDELKEKPQNWRKAIHPEDLPMIDRMFNQAIAGLDTRVTYRIYHSGKQEYRWIEDRISTRKNAHREVKQIYGAARDVTDQQRITLELEQASQLVNRLITSSDQVFYIVSIDQEDPFKNTFTYLSAQVERIIGFSVEDVRNEPLLWLSAIHPEDLEGVKTTTKEMFTSKSPRTRVYRMKHKHTAKYVWLEDYVVPIVDDAGRIREFYASARDFTARKEAEIEREQLIAELNRRHDELMQFSHIVSHNLRSPVANILGLAQFLNEDVSKTTMTETAGHLLKAAQSMDDVLRDLNTVLSVRSSLEEKMQTFSMDEIISVVCTNLKKEIDESGATIHISVDPSADELRSVKSYVQSALFNLITNAIKYRSPERIPLISVKVVRRGIYTEISVGDNGLGIDLKVHKQRIFALYGRLHLDREGKGLGLYMTKTQIESLQGTITVESEIGQGSTFKIIL
jgi:PAS domain S-box-containing protein